MFQQAIAADPNYALAYAGLGETYNVDSQLWCRNHLPAGGGAGGCGLAQGTRT